MLDYTPHDDEKLDTILLDAKINPNFEVQGLKPVLVMRREGKQYSFLNLHGLCACVSTYKGGKTTWIWTTIGLATNTTVSNLFESCLNLGDRVAIFDTEQGRHRCQLNINKFFPGGSEVDIDIFSLRHVTTEDLLPIIERYVTTQRPKLIAIDICSDLVYNTNDIEQSSFVVNKLAELSEKYELHVLCSIHLSRNGEATGHLGSALLKRSDLVVKLKRIGEVNCVFPQYARDEPFPPYGFQIQDGMPVIVDTIPSRSKKGTARTKSGDFQAVSNDQHIQVLTNIFASADTGLKPKDFKPLLRKEYSLRISKIGELLTKELQRYYIEQSLLEKKAGLLYLGTLTKNTDG